MACRRPTLPTLLVLALLASAMAGCTLPGFGDDEDDRPWYPTDRPTVDNADPGPPLVWGGVVVDALDGAPVPAASIRLDLAQVAPCKRQGIGWSSWDARTAANGTFGPFETATPRSGDVAFFLHVEKPGYTGHVEYVGPAEAARGTRDLTVVLHPNATLEGRAPPGTVVALDAPDFPRLTAADAEGRWSFPHARITNVSLVAATDPPQHARTAPPAVLDFEAPTNTTAWRLEGVVRTAGGAPVPAEVVAWNGTQLWSAARANDAGYFVLPLPPEPVDLRIDASTPDGRYAGTRAFDLNGPPGVRETVLVQAMC